MKITSRPTWHMPAVPATCEPEAGGVLEFRTSQGIIEALPLKTKKSTLVSECPLSQSAVVWRSAVPPCKTTILGGLVDCLCPQWSGGRGSGESHLSTQPPPTTCCMQLCFNCKWPLEVVWVSRLGTGAPSVQLRVTHHPC